METTYIIHADEGCVRKRLKYNSAPCASIHHVDIEAILSMPYTFCWLVV